MYEAYVLVHNCPSGVGSIVHFEPEHVKCDTKIHFF